MKVLVACECSGIIREAFRKKGHEAWSCDVKPTEIASDYHIQDNVLNHLDEGWDLMIAHPPCTYLCRNRDGNKNTKKNNIVEDRIEANSFFFDLLNADIHKICVENPVPSKASNLPQYDQIIQPYQHGHDYSKKTCLWLKNLPKLKPTKTVDVTYITTKNGYRATKGWYQTPRNSTDRSRSFTGIADAMANQWGNLIVLLLEQRENRL